MNPLLLLLTFDTPQWISVVTAGITVAALIALGKLLSGKANKADVDAEFVDLRAVNKVQAEESLRQYRELLTALEAMKKDIVALDKNSLTRGDLVDMKADIKEVASGMREQTKLIDGMPDRLTSLEATRNKQSER